MNTKFNKSINLIHLILLITTIDMLMVTYVFIYQKSGLSSFLIRLYGNICHQGNGLFVFGKSIKLPLCYRCMGIHTFLFLGGWVYKLFFYRKKYKMPSILLIVCTFPMIIDVFFEISKYLNNSVISFTTGSMFGFACILFIFQGLRTK